MLPYLWGAAGTEMELLAVDRALPEAVELEGLGAFKRVADLGGCMRYRGASAFLGSPAVGEWVLAADAACTTPPDQAPQPTPFWHH